MASTRYLNSLKTRRVQIRNSDGIHAPESATTTAPPSLPRPLQWKNIQGSPKWNQDTRLTAPSTILGTLYITIYGTPSSAIRPIAPSVSWTMVDCARLRLHRPKHAFAPRSYTNQTTLGLDPKLYT